MKHPRTPPPWVGEALGIHPVPGPGMPMTQPPNSGLMGEGAGVHTPVYMHVCVHMAHVYTPPTCTLSPTCAHAHFLQHVSGCTLR